MRTITVPTQESVERRRRLREWLSSVAVHLVLFVLLFIVLLPLLWMTVTAFKQRGKGLVLNPIPSTLVTIEADSTPIPPKDPGAPFAPVTFELDDPQREYNRVSIRGSFNNWEENASPLAWSRGVWRRTFASEISPETTLEYKFFINGATWLADPANPPAAPDGNSVLTVHGPTSNKPLADASRISGPALIIDYHAPDLAGLTAEVRRPDSHWLSVPLELEGERWKGSVELSDWDFKPEDRSIARRYRHRISWGDAWRGTYTLANFQTILTDPDYPFGRFFLNSLIVATGCGLVTVVLCLIAGYAFAVKEFVGRDVIFWALFATMLIPGLVFVLPQFAIVNALGWRNTYQGMMLPHVANIFGLFLMRQYIMTLPKDLFAAARVDGAGEFAVLRNVVIPLSLPIIITLFLLTFMSQWSNFLWQLIVNTPDSPLRTLPVGLALFRGQHDVDWELMMAGACFSVIPIALLFLVAQRFFIQGLTAGAVKG